MKVKQIISELGPSNGSLAPIQGGQNGKQQYKVSPSTAPAAPGQAQMVKLVPSNAQPGTPGQDPQGTVTVSADQIDMSDPANPKLNPQALNPQAQTPNQQSGALTGKTVTMGLGEEPNEDMLAPNTTSTTQTPQQISRPNSTNTLKLGAVKNGQPTLSDGDPLQITKSGKEIDSMQASIEVNQNNNRVGYLMLNGIQYIVVNTGHSWRIGPKAYKAIMSNYNPQANQQPQVNQPLQQEEQGEDSPLSRIAHLAGIR